MDELKKCRVCEKILIPYSYEEKKGLCKNHLNEYNRDYYKKNPEKYKKRYRDNKDLYITSMQNNRAKKLGVPGYISKEDWNLLKNYYLNRCAYCFYETDNLQMEHVIPISLWGKDEPLSQFATHTVDNVVPACEFCNGAKNDRPLILLLKWYNSKGELNAA